ncbi:GtrA family protein [Acidimicrobiia bacterium EGI L10123]|uniref:GtrA family protein n=1 Tax=Salinilacustrithrix flava TaxID=2957203 RepID=UPI003D7C2C25|nr:GtrA family protein [Acidimicrobiia bacterium EGI L10123]
MPSLADAGPDTALGRRPWIAKLAKYSAASLAGVVTSTSTLFLMLEVFDVAPVPSNIAAVTVGAVPNYLINRAWTFNKRGAHSFTREVLPFWGMAILGLIISTFAVAWAAGRYDENTLILMMANVGSFGLLWVGRFFILDRLLFKPLADILEEHEDAEGHFHLHADQVDEPSR